MPPAAFRSFGDLASPVQMQQHTGGLSRLPLSDPPAASPQSCGTVLSPLSHRQVAASGENLDRWLEVTPRSLCFRELHSAVAVPQQRRELLPTLRAELCSRLARGVVQIQSLPHGLGQMPGLLQAAESYKASLRCLDSCRRPEDDEWRFHDSLRDAFSAQSDLLRPVFDEVLALQRHHGAEKYEAVLRPSVDAALQELLSVRVSCRFLMQHALQASSMSANSRQSGALEYPCDVVRLMREAGKNSMSLCVASLGQAATIVVTPPDDLPKVLCAPASLLYALHEVMKNSCRATVERHARSGFDDFLPPVQCGVELGRDELTLTVADSGGGIPSEKLDKVWGFAFSTAARSAWELEQSASRPVLAGFGVGLPVSRTYLRYFGGDLTLSSEPGRGATARLGLSLREDGCERLPASLL